MTGVLLVNMGGAESSKELKMFLRLMFLDKHIIAAPFVVRNFLSLYISNTRYKKSWKRYELIGGTPIKKDTVKLSNLLQKELGNTYIVKPCFSYSSPFIKDAINELLLLQIKKIIVVPLYPQSSITTTESVVCDVNKSVINNKDVEVSILSGFYNNPKFISFWNLLIKQHIENRNLQNPLLVFTAHSIPKSFIKKGDVYKFQIEESVRLIADSLGLNFEISYQSAINSKTWLGPDTVVKVNQLISSNIKEIVLIPISFVNENLETLYDIDKVMIPLFKNSNVSRVHISSFHHVFIDLLKELVYEHNN